MYIPSNVTAEEFFKNYCKDENAIKFFEESTLEKEDTEKDLTRLRRGEDITSEQLYFAHELIDLIETQLKNATSLNEFKKQFAIDLSDSMLER